MTPNAALLAAIGSDRQRKPVAATSTDASSCAVAFHPVTTNCFVESRYVTASSVAAHSMRKLMTAGVVSASCEGQRGWSITGISWSSSDARFPSALTVRRPSGTAATQYSPLAAIGGWKSWILFSGVADPSKSVSHMWVKAPWRTSRPAKYCPSMNEKSVLFAPNTRRRPSLAVPLPAKSFARAMRPLK